MKINNLATYALTKAYILATLVDGEYWFFSAWDDFDRAVAQATECGCSIFRRAEVDA